MIRKSHTGVPLVADVVSMNDLKLRHGRNIALFTAIIFRGYTLRTTSRKKVPCGPRVEKLTCVRADNVGNK